MCQASRGQGGLMGRCQWARGAWMGATHFDTFVDLSWQEVFIFSSWLPEVGCSISALEPCGFWVSLVILKTPSGLLQSPWAPLYIPLPRETHPHALWGQQVSCPANGGPGWALTSQSPILTPLVGDGEQFRCFGGRNEAFVIPLKRPPNSLPASSL